MTAPRRTGRRSTPAGAPRRPSSITLALVSLALAVALPIGAAETAHRYDSVTAVVVAVSGTVLAAVLVFLAATRRRAGIPIMTGGLLLPALVSSALIVAAYGGIGYWWDESRGLEADFVGLDVLLPLALMAIATYAIVYPTLSMARR